MHAGTRRKIVLSDMGSCLPWGSLTLILLFVLLQSMLHSSSGCFVEERAALMDIRSSLIRASSVGAPGSWGEDGDDCCLWERVMCNNSTQRVSHLNLSFVYVIDSEETWYLNSTVFSALHELEYLDLSYNYAGLLALEGLIGLAKLRYLDLSNNAWGGRFPEFIGKIGSLEVLDLSGNSITGGLPATGLLGLAKLRYLDLSFNSLGGAFPEFIGQIVSLEVLDLSYNSMTGGLPAKAVENLRNLRQLNMCMNRFAGNLPALLFALPHLKILDLSDNHFDGNIPIGSFSGPISLEVLDLRYNRLNGTLPVTGIAAFENIRNLNLGFNFFSGSLPVSIFSLPHLKFLDLSRNKFKGHFRTNFSSKPVPLEVLHLEHNKLSGALPNEQAYEILKNLREVYLSSNQFSGIIPTFLFSLPRIERVDLSTNLFGGNLPINSSSDLSLSLKSLKFSQNNLSGKLSFIWLRNLTKLEEIDLSDNGNLVIDVNIPGWTPPFQLKQLLLAGCDLNKNTIAEPHFLSTQHHLELLDLSSNNLSGSMPNWLFTEETKLKGLNLGNNSLTGSLDPIWHAQSFLTEINIHMNHITGQLPANISSMFPSLYLLDISSNNFSGHIPTSLCKINSILILDMSNNKLSGEVPTCVFTNYTQLSSLKVSNNELGGLIFGGLNMPSSIQELCLDGNRFEGMIPHNLSGLLTVMDFHDNKLFGKLDTSFWDLPYLKVLNLAGNYITGKIHPQICGLTEIDLIDLSRNRLTGSVPNCSFRMLAFLNLSGNSLSGDISYSFFNISSLLALDIRHNQFTGNLQWLSHIDNIRLLSLGGNEFEGQITPNLCKLLYLRIIDLSHNKLSGSLPVCIGDISFKSHLDDQIFQSSWAFDVHSYMTFYNLRGFTFATKGNLYMYGHNFFDSMSGMDLSANMLDGEIPWELGNLSHIKSLNLSNNLFIGSIPATFGSMEEIESLDLSHNELSGPIPWQLNQLSSLGVFSVAYNNLSGCIPNSGQLGSFSMDSYLANVNLHQITQGNMCAAPSPDSAAEKDAGEAPTDPVLYGVTAAAFVLAFWATVGFSFFHPYGRSVMLKL